MLENCDKDDLIKIQLSTIVGTWILVSFVSLWTHPLMYVFIFLPLNERHRSDQQNVIKKWKKKRERLTESRSWLFSIDRFFATL